MLLYKLYKIVRTFKDGRTDKANNHWFARAITTQTVETDQIADLIQARCTLTKADVKGCIESFIGVIKEQIQDSKAVKLNGLGTFKIGLKTVGAESPGDFSVNSNVTGAHVLFYPSRSVNSATGQHNVTLLDGLKIKETPENKVVKL